VIVAAGSEERTFAAINSLIYSSFWTQRGEGERRRTEGKREGVLCFQLLE
jgi:hypothetical protein